MSLMEEWEKFKSEKIAKWLEPQKLNERSLEQADSEYQKFLEKMREETEQKRKKGGYVDPYLLEDTQERKAGFRGQKWVDEMLWDMGPIPHNTHWRDDLPDTTVQRFGTLETKTIPEIGRNYVDIKEGAWDPHPSTYLVVVRVCDEKFETFQFVGWFYGHQVYELEYIPKEEGKHERASYRAEITDLNGSRRFLKKIIELSKENPMGIYKK